MLTTIGAVGIAPALATPGADQGGGVADPNAHPGRVRAQITFTKSPAHPWHSTISWKATRQRVDGSWRVVDRASWRAGSGLPGGSATNACVKNHGWLPDGQYSLRQYDDYAGNLIHGRVFRLSDHRCVNGTLREVADRLLWEGVPERAVGTSKTFKQLARLSGAPAQRKGPFVRRSVTARDLEAWIPRLATLRARDRAKLQGVSRSRSRQIVAGAIAARAGMMALNVGSVDICPLALREGIILHYLQSFNQPFDLPLRAGLHHGLLQAGRPEVAGRPGRAEDRRQDRVAGGRPGRHLGPAARRDPGPPGR